jgi:two-component system OmpR family response regulator
MRLLVIEDDERSARYLVRGLTESGHIADWSADGETGSALAEEGIYDVLVVDRRLGSQDGLALVSTLRSKGITTPILMLSAAASVHEQSQGLREGCDDYLAKPYAFAELLARVEGLERRSARRYAARLSVGDLIYEPANRTAIRAGRTIELQGREAALVEKLMRHAHSIVTRSMLLESAWDYSFEPRGNIIDMHVHRLRRKIDDGFAYPLIHTVAGAGYLMTDRRCMNSIS